MRREFVISLAFGLLTTACDIAKKKRKTEGEAANRPVNAAELGKGGPLTLSLDGVEHIVLVKSGNGKRLAGLDAQGLPRVKTLQSPTGLLVEAFSFLPDQGYLGIQFAKPAEKSSVSLSSGEDLFQDCAGLLVYLIQTQKSECFDAALGRAKAETHYTLLQAGSVDSDAIYAVRRIKSAADASVSVQLVKRKSKTDLEVVTESFPKPGLEFKAQSRLGLLTLEKSDTGSEEWWVTAGRGVNYTRTKLDLFKLLGEANGCFYYAKNDKRTLGVFCPQANATVDSFSGPLPDGFDPATRISSFGPLENDKRMFLNESGQGFSITGLKSCCEPFNLPTGKVILTSLFDGQHFVHATAGTGLYYRKMNDTNTKVFLQEYIVSSYTLNRAKDHLIFVASDAAGKLLAGSVKLDSGEVRVGAL